MVKLIFFYLLLHLQSTLCYKVFKSKAATKTEYSIEKEANIVHKSLDDITEQDLDDFDTVYQLGNGHSLIHKTNLNGKENAPREQIIGTSSDQWLEIKYGKLETIYGQVIAHGSIAPSNSDGSLAITRSQNIGVTFDYNAPSQTTRFLLFLQFSRATTFEIAGGISMSTSASCTVPAGKYGGLYMFEPTDIYEVETRSWKKKASFKKIKQIYLPSSWGRKIKSIVRSFKDTNFVCTNDETYILAITPKIQESVNGRLVDFGEYNQ